MITKLEIGCFMGPSTKVRAYFLVLMFFLRFGSHCSFDPLSKVLGSLLVDRSVV